MSHAQQRLRQRLADVRFGGYEIIRRYIDGFRANKSDINDVYLELSRRQPHFLMKRQLAFLFIGVALMAWGGASMVIQIRANGWHRGDLAIFAVGLMLIARSYVSGVEARVAVLEAALRSGDAGKAT